MGAKRGLSNFLTKIRKKLKIKSKQIPFHIPKTTKMKNSKSFIIVIYSYRLPKQSYEINGLSVRYPQPSPHPHTFIRKFFHSVRPFVLYSRWLFFYKEIVHTKRAVEQLGRNASYFYQQDRSFHLPFFYSGFSLDLSDCFAYFS